MPSLFVVGRLVGDPDKSVDEATFMPTGGVSPSTSLRVFDDPPYSLNQLVK